LKSFFPLLTTSEARDAAQRHAVVLFPIGTIEASAPQVPLGYDYLVAESLARQVAERTNDLWLPPITYGVSERLAAFPCTLFVESATLAQQVESILRGLVVHGFDHILLLTNHIPNQEPVAAACRRIRKDFGILVASVYPGQLAADLSKDVFAGESGTKGHGSEPGTSLLLHLYPDDVRMDLARPSELKSLNGLEIVSISAVRFGDSQVNFFMELDDLTDRGGWADPTKATAAKGRTMMERMVEYVASFVEVFRAFQVNVPMKTIVDVPH
jgi:creatinine amidohydrolase